MSGRRAGFAIIVAATASDGIGAGGKLPWRLPGDMKFFREKTSKVAEQTENTSANAPAAALVRQNALIMGRKTWQSIPSKFRPLPGRLNIVLTRGDPEVLGLPPGVLSASSLDDALHQAAGRKDCAAIFVIGGGSVYEQALCMDSGDFMCDRIFLTRVHSDVKCDTFFDMPAVAGGAGATRGEPWQLVASSEMKEHKGTRFQFLEYELQPVA